MRNKVLAAQRADVREVLLPARNRKDLHDVPESTQQKLKFTWLDMADDALEPAPSELARRPDSHFKLV